MASSKVGYAALAPDGRECDVEDKEEQTLIINSTRKRYRPSHILYFVVIPLVISNILFSSLWWRCYLLSDEGCVRPKLSYCAFYLARNGYLFLCLFFFSAQDIS